VFNHKQQRNVNIHKLAARIVVQGDLQIILDESENTYLPIAECSTIHLWLVLTVDQQLESSTTDFNAAFVPSDLPEPIYLDLPPGHGGAVED
jgi:Reverse transcriptase (RNA-dependent DNA polymerase)